MLLSSKGFYDVYAYFPYYTEFSLIIEAIAFSFLLAYQLEEAQKKEFLLNEKKLFLKELNHRIKNSLQYILHFIELEKEEEHTQVTSMVLEKLENRIFSMDKLYGILNTSEHISMVNTNTLFSLIIKYIKQSFQKPNITIILKTDMEIDSNMALYCGLILNEALSNSYEHAFCDTDRGEIIVKFVKENKRYNLSIQDNGRGFLDTNIDKDRKGMFIINTLACSQLKGTINIEHHNGTKINIKWKTNE